MFCHKCGTRLEEGTAFCNKCGAAQTEEEAVSTETKPEMLAPPNPSSSPSTSPSSSPIPSPSPSLNTSASPPTLIEANPPKATSTAPLNQSGSNTRKYVIIGSVCVVALALIGFLIAYFNNGNSSNRGNSGGSSPSYSASSQSNSSSTPSGNFEGTRTIGGDVYTGKWENGVFVQGRIEYSNGNYKDGRYSNNQLVEGALYIASTNQLQNGKFDSSGDLYDGMVIFGNGSVYEGKWGTEYLLEGTKYIAGTDTYERGTFTNGEITEGIVVFSNGSIMEGTFLYNEQYYELNNGVLYQDWMAKVYVDGKVDIWQSIANTAINIFVDNVMNEIEGFMNKVDNVINVLDFYFG